MRRSRWEVHRVDRGIGLELHDSRNLQVAQAGTVAGKSHNALDVRALPDAIQHAATVMIQAKCVEVRPRLRERAEVGGGVRYNGAIEPHHKTLHGAMREQWGDELCERGFRSPVADVVHLARPDLGAVPLECGEGGAFA
ncbi:hypothetical protein GSI_11540 [Ganoderma sinense ZZ0214-1]|uniref:Uncharacterized protein n=1 Tax=Ganoderma sinense ZZ0214-1 TaxID=1077348 RepID=A0A2G8RW97_9APHY|nr:hypothetical protein GSI_11540 [Ganoderma sinense ZZ0214-1]